MNKDIYLGIEDLVANAMIEILKADGTPEVSFQDLEEYGNRVVKRLNQEGIKAYLLLSRESTDHMFYRYQDFFERKRISNEGGVVLKNGVIMDDLIKRFRTYLDLDAMLAFMNKGCTEFLIGKQEELER